jgi:hypothetical protein
VIRVHSPAPYKPRDIPAGTKVRGWASGRVGIVQPHRLNQMGTFSVRWADPGTGAIWEVVTADDVTIVTDTKAGAA